MSISGWESLDMYLSLFDSIAYPDLAMIGDVKNPELNVDILNLGHDLYVLDSSLDLNTTQSDLMALDQNAAILHYSVPTVKLAYPEPFIASASLMHSDLWFIHILIYQYWLWFVFVFIIIFFFLTFLSVVRWCNVRIRPRRETRGVSRSKCGDLITACVPVSWATSIIIHESTDAIDLYDGFGTSELVIGIRAYQWGWEYYYPKDLDVNYRLKNNFSYLVGNSFKYESASSHSLESQSLWRLYQLRNADAVVNPLFPLIATDSSGLVNLFNFSGVGFTPSLEPEAFNRTRASSKMVSMRSLLTSNQSFKGVNQLRISPFDTFQNVYKSLSYGLKRQVNFVSNRDFTNGQVPAFENQKGIGNVGSEFIGRLPFMADLSVVSSQGVSNNLDNLSSDLNFLYPNFVKVENLENSSFSEKSPLRLSRQSFSGDTRFIHGEKLFREGESQPLQTTSVNFQPTSNNGAYEMGLDMRQGGLFSGHSFRTGIGPFIDMNTSRARESVHTYFDLNVNPFVSSQGVYHLHDFDSSKSSRSTVPLVFQSQPDNVLPNMTNTYWNSIWSASTAQWRMMGGRDFQFLETRSVPALFPIFYDYEFRNWQAMDLLEDAWWDDLIMGNGFYDLYDNLCGDGIELQVSKRNRHYWSLERGLSRTRREKLGIDTNMNDMLSHLTELSTLALEGDLTAPADHSWNHTSPSLSTVFGLQSMDGSTEAFSHWRQFLEVGDRHMAVKPKDLAMSTSVTSLVNTFRSDWDGNSEMGIDENSKDHSHTNNFLLFLQDSLLPTDLLSNVELSDSLPLRPAAKNIIVSANALIKVFKSRYDDNRSLARLEDFSELNSRQILISGPRPSYEKFLSKNNTSMISIKFFTSRPLDVDSLSSHLLYLHNFPFFDLPFLDAKKSEASRYLWTDWYAKWGVVDIQPSSSSRFAIFGMPYFSRGFSFSPLTNSNFTESENYFTRISRARRNYLPTWVFTPYLMTHARNLSYDGLGSGLSGVIENANASIQLQVQALQETWGHPRSFPLSTYTGENGFSSTSLYLKSAPFGKTKSSIYVTSMVKLEDSIAKKSQILKSLDFGSSSERHPQALNLSPALLNQPTSITTGAFLESRVKDPEAWINLPTYPGELEGHFKNQYRPMKKGINNLLRLHATGAVAIPTEVRIQVLASSKDVIHSWSVPSAGVKIDCVPGYSSHRIMMFLVTGIFWGQCMEVCGRYHHWMPIVVYFMKRDLFWLWCSHFIFFNTSNNQFGSADHVLSDRLGLVSFDRSAWLDEIR